MAFRSTGHDDAVGGASNLNRHPDRSDPPSYWAVQYTERYRNHLDGRRFDVKHLLGENKQIRSLRN